MKHDRGCRTAFSHAETRSREGEGRSRIKSGVTSLGGGREFHFDQASLGVAIIAELGGRSVIENPILLVRVPCRPRVHEYGAASAMPANIADAFAHAWLR